MSNFFSGVYMFVMGLLMMPFVGTLLLALFGDTRHADVWTWILSMIPMIGVGVAALHIF